MQLSDCKAEHEHSLCGLPHKTQNGADTESWHAPESQMLSYVASCRCIAPQQHVPCAAVAASGRVAQRCAHVPSQPAGQPSYEFYQPSESLRQPLAYLQP